MITAGQRSYQPFGAGAELWRCRAPEVLLSGPAGTGKSRACLEKAYACCLRWPGARGLIVRKTRASLTQSGLVTWEEKVLPEGSPVAAGVRRDFRQSYRFPNGAEVVVGGMDNATRVMSTEYDWVYVQEATELEEAEWEALISRLRNGVMPFQQLMADCNPDAATHWLNQRCLAGSALQLESRHEDNPVLWDRAAGAWTAFGAQYIANLDRLTGARLQRLRYGRWAGAEGVVYEEWDPLVHVVKRRPVPHAWRRLWAVDFGYTHPFVWQNWAVDGDGRMLLTQEIYATGRLVEDLAKEILAATQGQPRPEVVVCDHDAEDRATLERHLCLPTRGAQKAISPGIQACKSRLARAGDGRARALLFEDCLRAPDPALRKRREPSQTREEFDRYAWDLTVKKGERPVDRFNHGLDAWRYAVAELDGLGMKQMEVW